MTNKDRIEREIVTPFGERELRSFTRDELQTFLDSKSSMSFSTVDHLCWDLRQILEMAVEEGIIKRNPATLLFTPRECSKPEHRRMTKDEVKFALSVLDLRERLIFELAVFAGLRPAKSLLYGVIGSLKTPQTFGSGFIAGDSIRRRQRSPVARLHFGRLFVQT
jgi:hypothetical protein